MKVNPDQLRKKAVKDWRKFETGAFTNGVIIALLIAYVSNELDAPLSKTEIKGTEDPRAIELHWIPQGIVLRIEYIGKLTGYAVWEPPVDQQTPEYTLTLMKAKKAVDKVRSKVGAKEWRERN